MSKISVIIPTYNRAAVLHRAIYSVFGQTYEDWEIIIVDDCSTDKTQEIVHFWLKNHPDQIQYLRLNANSGSPVLPRNLGVNISTGEYLAFLDSDDYWTNNKLETQLWYMKYHDSHFSYHDLWVGEEKLSQEWSRMSTCHSDYVFKFLLRKNFIPTSSVMMKKELYQTYKGMDPELIINHDWDLWLRIAYHEQIHYINEKMGHLALHEGSVIGNTHRRRADSRKIVRKWKDQVHPNYYRKIILYYYLMEVFDKLPEELQDIIRTAWYNQDKYKG
jgi:glycosyltransferase involved in cell wall biosynthesis